MENNITIYPSGKGDVLIADMASPHLIHSIAKLGQKIGMEKMQSFDTGDDEKLLKALKSEAIGRLSEKNNATS